VFLYLPEHTGTSPDESGLLKEEIMVALLFGALLATAGMAFALALPVAVLHFIQKDEIANEKAAREEHAAIAADLQSTVDAYRTLVVAQDLAAA
jgi:hypothetical protein